MTQEDGIVFLKELKWQKKCSKCLELIEVGQQSWWNKQSNPNEYYHINCYVKPQANPKSAKASGSQAVKPVGASASSFTTSSGKGASSEALLDIEAKVQARLAKAKEIVERQFPGMQEYDGWLPMVVETFHQLYGEQSIQDIQKSKEKNIASVR